MQRRAALRAAGAAVAAAALAGGTATRYRREEAVPTPAPSVLLLGDSLTWGQTGPGTALPGGFRAPLHALLAARGVAHRFAGSRHDNATAALTGAGQDAHEGWPGYRVDQVADLALPSADAALVLLGTNDVHQGRAARPTARRLVRLLDALPPAVLVLPPPYLRDPDDARPDALSASLGPALRELAGPAVPVVDAWSPLLHPDGTVDRGLLGPDGIHLTADGYARLAALVAGPLGALLRRV